MRVPPNKIDVIFDDRDFFSKNKIERSNNFLFLDSPAITTKMSLLSECDPYFRRVFISYYIEKLSRRVAERFSDMLSISWCSKRPLIADAIYFHVWTELANIIALRRLALWVGRSAPQKKILIDLPNLDITCLKLWDRSEIEPLLLARALQTRGCRVGLVTRSGAGTNAKAVRFYAYRSSVGFPPVPVGRDGDNYSNRCAIAPEGIRRVDALVGEILNPLIIGAGQMSKGEDPGSLTLCLKEKQPFFGMRRCTLTWPTESLLQHFAYMLAPQFRDTREWARAVVRKFDIKKIFVCDHLFMTSSLLGGAVKERRGRVGLWPHSANPCHVDQRSREGFDEVLVPMNWARELWERKHPDKYLELRPDSVFTRRSKAEFVAGLPLTIVVFGGAHFYGRLPICRVESHIRSYQNFFSCQPGKSVTLKFRPKDSWEDSEWFWRWVSVPVEIESAPPYALNYKNMIFVTVTLGSTALLEGISFGVPCMIVREQEILDYTPLTPDIVPIGDAKTIWQIILKCQNIGFYEKIVKLQTEWFSNQIGQIRID